MYAGIILLAYKRLTNGRTVSAPINMTTSNIIRFTILGILWLGLVGYILTHSQVTLYTLFVCAASWIIIFVPMYKKYVKKSK